MNNVLTNGVADDFAAKLALQNFPNAPMQSLSLCTTPIELLSLDGSDTVLSRATGFFWERHGRTYLITNYHVVSGRDAFSAELRSSQGFIPRRIAFYGVELAVSTGIVSFQRRRWVLQLDEDFHEKVLLKPPTVEGVEIDLFAFALSDGLVLSKDLTRRGFVGAEHISSHVSDHSIVPILTSAGDDCFILGYPLANYDGLMPPIWKRGAIASETNIGVGGKPIFLVDASTTAGMSGSPVIRKVTTITANNGDIGALQEFNIYRFIGVYAGRLENRQLESVNIGYAWYGSLIEKLLETLKWNDPVSAAKA